MSDNKDKDVARMYKRKQIESASPGRLIVMLYDAVLDNLKKAEEVITGDEADRFEKFHNHMMTSQNIITELTVALDMEKGGEIAKNLFRLYDFCNWRLVDGNVKKDTKAIQEVRKVLEVLKSGWEEIQDTPIPDGDIKKLNQGLNLQG
ncbi:MAG: flagellar protein FliS [Chlamydiales bacterium]|jgi:flagellar protein FliS